ncbi:MAG: hypothetical protein ACREJQ_01930 [bacterium]
MERPLKIVLLVGAGGSQQFCYPLMNDFLDDFETTLAKHEPVHNHRIKLLEFFQEVIDLTLPLPSRYENPRNLERVHTLLGMPGTLRKYLVGVNEDQAIKLCDEVRDILVLEIFQKYSGAEHHKDMIVKLFDPLVTRILKLTGGNLTVFTTNYDRCLDVFFKTRGPFYDGFNSDKEGTYDRYGSSPQTKSPIKLFHLHGATNWGWFRDERGRKTCLCRIENVDYQGRSPADYRDIITQPGELIATDLHIPDEPHKIEPVHARSEFNKALRVSLNKYDWVVVIGYQGDGRIKEEFSNAKLTRAGFGGPLKVLVINGKGYVENKDKGYFVQEFVDEGHGCAIKGYLTAQTAPIIAEYIETVVTRGSTHPYVDC